MSLNCAGKITINGAGMLVRKKCNAITGYYQHYTRLHINNASQSSL